MKQTTKTKFAVCVKNDEYEASPESHKIYPALADRFTDHHKMIRVVDESGEDHLQPKDVFVAITVSKSLKRVLVETT